MNATWKKIVCLWLVICIVATSSLAQQTNASADYQQGLLDGKEAANKQSEIFYGCLSYGGTLICCLIGIYMAFIAPSSANPEPPAEFLLGKNSDYIQGFRNGYAQEIRSKRKKNATIGLILGVMTNVAVNLIVLSLQQ